MSDTSESQSVGRPTQVPGDANAKPRRVYEWRDGVRVEIVNETVLLDAIKKVSEARADEIGLGGLMEIIRRRSKLES